MSAPNIVPGGDPSGVSDAMAAPVDHAEEPIPAGHVEMRQLVADYYTRALRSSEISEILTSLSQTLNAYLHGLGYADQDAQTWVRLSENSAGVPAGTSAGPVDEDVWKLAWDELTDDQAPKQVVDSEGNDVLLLPMPDPTGDRPLIGVAAARLQNNAQPSGDVRSILATMLLATAINIDRVARIQSAGRDAQYARAAARAQLRLTEPHDRPEALRVAIDELATCEDLTGAIACEISDGHSEIVARFGSIDEESALELVDKGASGESGDQTALPVVIDGHIEAMLVTERTSVQMPADDDMLHSIAAAVAGSVARFRATGTIESLRRSATRRLVEAQERERSMVAADIHDGVLQQLGATAIRLELAQARVQQGDFDTARNIIEDGAKEIRSCARELRSLLMELRPQVLDDNGLNAALTELGRHVEGVEVSVRSDVPDDLGSEFSITVFRIVQEALTNIQKHANASNAEVSVELDGSRISIQVRDDGVGYEGAVSGPSSAGGHLGLLGMRERARMLGGEFSIEGASGGGTVVRALLPLAGASRNGGSEGPHG
ncbi:MAG TPA: sensor histidine kinase [Solirubrobacterales bacterium]|nr:sensor histidine kinase [Solirubrobacterales bacterium]